MSRGVRIIPEITTPTNTFSWSKDPTLKDINIFCSDPANGQLDPTLQETYDALTGIFTQVDIQFPDAFVHFGGNKADDICYDKKSEIKQFMKENGI